MKNLSLLTFLLVSCSSLAPRQVSQRSIASMQKNIPFRLELQLSHPTVFANGADVVYLKILTSNEASQPVEVDPSELKVLIDGDATIGSIKYEEGSYQTFVRPKVKSSDLRIMVVYKNQHSQIHTIKTTLKPRSDKMQGYKSDFVSRKYINGLTYRHKEGSPEGQQDGFSIINRGLNSIVPIEESSRSFDFNYDEQAAQNLSVMLSDSPNGTVSHTMHSEFMFFPRKYLPFAEINEKEEVKVTLPNGEELLFSTSGEILSGVFDEGPVDTGPDRFNRTYADLKYQGKGILLRANARGQMPQQGQFENTKIDMDYGIKYSSDVLIINGTTGQRCRRPKIDFWSAADVSPILFKFPSDQEFDKYLKEKCGFGIPELSFKAEPALVNFTKELEVVWTKCLNGSDVKSCLLDEIELIKDPEVKAKVKFEATLRIFAERKEEEKKIPQIISDQTSKIHTMLLKDASWYAKGCYEKSKTLLTLSLKFHDSEAVMKEALHENCAKVQAEMSAIATVEAASMRQKLEADLSWASLISKEVLINDCLKRARSFINSSFKYYQAPELYQESLKATCESIESTAAFQSWVKSQTIKLEETIYVKLSTDIELRGEKEAKLCLKDFPVNTQLNRIRFKRQREACLTDGWSDIEQQAIDKMKNDPAVKMAKLPLDKISLKIFAERRDLQLKIIKKFFR